MGFANVRAGSTQLQPNTPLKLLASDRTELIVEFALPTAPLVFGLNVSGGLDFFVNFSGTNFTEVEIGANVDHNHAAPGPVSHNPRPALCGAYS